MPSSLLAQWPFILGLLRSSPRPAGKVLDVGPGWGKASILLREYVPTVTGVSALEAFPGYVKDHHLALLYDQVRVGFFEDARAWLNRFDTILMVDVVEHMPLGPALRAIERCRGQVIICTPCVLEEAWSPGMPETEHHVSLWGPGEFCATSHPVEELIQRNQGWIVRLGPKEDPCA